MAAIEEAGIRAHVALPEQGGRTGLFTIEDFVYDAEKDLYTCPSGETLHRLGRDYKGGHVRYGAKPSSCEGCHLKGECTNSKKGRWLGPKPAVLPASTESANIAGDASGAQRARFSTRWPIRRSSHS